MQNVMELIFNKTFKRPYKLTIGNDQGSGQSVVLLHGLASSSAVWQPLYDLPTRDLRLISVDLLGFGKSPKPLWLEYSVEDHARAVAAAIRRMRVPKPVTLVGHSMGCIIAIHIAYKYPKLVKKLVLYQPPIFLTHDDHKLYSRKAKSYLKTLGFIAARPNLAVRYSSVVGKWANKRVAFTLDSDSAVPFSKSLKNTIISQNAYAELLLLTIPIDIIHGTRDRIVIRKGIKELFAAHDDMNFHEVDEIHGLSTKSATELQRIILS